MIRLTTPDLAVGGVFLCLAIYSLLPPISLRFRKRKASRRLTAGDEKRHRFEVTSPEAKPSETKPMAMPPPLPPYLPPVTVTVAEHPVEAVAPVDTELEAQPDMGPDVTFESAPAPDERIDATLDSNPSVASEAFDPETATTSDAPVPFVVEAESLSSSGVAAPAAIEPEPPAVIDAAAVADDVASLITELPVDVPSLVDDGETPSIVEELPSEVDLEAGAAAWNEPEPAAPSTADIVVLTAEPVSADSGEGDVKVESPVVASEAAFPAQTEARSEALPPTGEETPVERPASLEMKSEPEPVAPPLAETQLSPEVPPDLPVTDGPQLSVRALIAKMNAAAKTQGPPSLATPTAEEKKQLKEMAAPAKKKRKSPAKEKPGDKI